MSNVDVCSLNSFLFCLFIIFYIRIFVWVQIHFLHTEKNVHWYSKVEVRKPKLGCKQSKTTTIARYIDILWYIDDDDGPRTCDNHLPGVSKTKKYYFYNSSVAIIASRVKYMPKMRVDHALLANKINLAQVLNISN